jgi:hypothetical protein
MIDLPAFPRPGQVKVVQVAVRILRSGAEICNLLTKAGRDEYIHRKRVLWERQGRICCLYGFIPSCPGKLNWADSSFEHELPRGHGGGSRDDRIERVVKGKTLWLNGASHAWCNSKKGSQRIDFNAAHNALQ